MDKVRAIQLSFLPMMFFIEREQDEDVKDYMKRATGKIYKRLKLAGGVKWDEKYHGMQWAWVGHVARFARFESKRWTLRVVKWKDSEHLRRLESLNKGRQLHARILRVWRWESPMVKFCGYLGRNRPP